MSRNHTKKPRGMAAQVKKAVQEMRQTSEKTTDPIEKRRLGELLALTDSTMGGEVADDPLNQGEDVKPAAKPKKF